MNLTVKHPIHTTINLHPLAVVSAEKIEAGTTVFCEDGTLWLTQANDYKDYMLKAGDKVVINKRNSVCIQALSEAHVSIVSHN